MNEVLTEKKVKTIEISVNNKPVQMADEHGRDEATGREIKAAAIEQGVNIQGDFSLFVQEGQEWKPVQDDEVIHLHAHLKFRAVAPDDSSGS